MTDVYICSNCGEECYYDGRCGDGPILMCKCPNGKVIKKDSN